jgi:Xaa-Pro aminopeptidase
MISARELTRRRHDLVARMDPGGFDAVLIADGLNFAYLTGMLSREFDKRFRHLAVFMHRSGAMAVLAPTSAAADVKARYPELKVIGYSDGPASAEMIASALKQSIGFESGRLGLEASGADRPCIPAKLTQELLRLLPGATTGDVAPIMADMRAIKSEEEIALLKAAGALAQTAWEQAVIRFNSGMAISSAAQVLASAFASLGADYNFPGHIEVRNVTRPERPTFEVGDVLWCDFGVTLDGYHSDISRRAVFGPANPIQSEDHARGCNLLTNLITGLESGRKISEAMRSMLQARRSLHRGGPQPEPGRHGHGIGLCAAESPSLSEYDATILVPGMVLTPEPSFIGASGEFVHLEEMVVIRSSGAERLTHGAETLYQVGKQYDGVRP